MNLIARHRCAGGDAKPAGDALQRFLRGQCRGESSSPRLVCLLPTRHRQIVDGTPSICIPPQMPMTFAAIAQCRLIFPSNPSLDQPSQSARVFCFPAISQGRYPEKAIPGPTNDIHRGWARNASKSVWLLMREAPGQRSELIRFGAHRLLGCNRILGVEMQSLQIGKHAEYGLAGTCLEPGETGVEQVDVSSEPVDDEPGNAPLLAARKAIERADELRKYTPTIDVGDENDAAVGRFRKAHVAMSRSRRLISADSRRPRQDYVALMAKPLIRLQHRPIAIVL